MTTETVVERTWSSPLAITALQAQQLAALGAKLASSKQYWGSKGEESPGSLIDARQAPDGRWQLYIKDAVGVIGVSDLTVTVQPKIPPAHFLHLLRKSALFPRVGPIPVQVQPDSSLWELVARWYLQAAAALLRTDLLRDYRPQRDDLALLRGHIVSVDTTKHYYQGRALMVCDFEEFDVDHALNRVLRTAIRHVVASSALPDDLRQEGGRLLTHLEGVGELWPGDMNVAVDRRSAHYEPALALAKLVIRHQGQGLRAGSQSAWSFLIRSPDYVEAGIRTVMGEALTGLARVTKKGLGLTPTKWTLNPDLVFDGGVAVGDVKYTRATADWSRDHLYQATTFAAGYRAASACIVVFQADDASGAPDVPVGDIRVSRLAWPSRPSLSASEAEALFTASCQAWWHAAAARHAEGTASYGGSRVERAVERSQSMREGTSCGAVAAGAMVAEADQYLG